MRNMVVVLKDQRRAQIEGRCQKIVPCPKQEETGEDAMIV